jgi:hypothetical protein
VNRIARQLLEGEEILLMKMPPFWFRKWLRVEGLELGEDPGWWDPDADEATPGRPVVTRMGVRYAASDAPAMERAAEAHARLYKKTVAPLYVTGMLASSGIFRVVDTRRNEDFVPGDIKPGRPLLIGAKHQYNGGIVEWRDGVILSQPQDAAIVRAAIREVVARKKAAGNSGEDQALDKALAFYRENGPFSATELLGGDVNHHQVKRLAANLIKAGWQTRTVSAYTKSIPVFFLPIGRHKPGVGSSTTGDDLPDF